MMITNNLKNASYYEEKKNPLQIVYKKLIGNLESEDRNDVSESGSALRGATVERVAGEIVRNDMQFRQLLKDIKGTNLTTNAAIQQVLPELMEKKIQRDSLLDSVTKADERTTWTSSCDKHSNLYNRSAEEDDEYCSEDNFIIKSLSNLNLVSLMTETYQNIGSSEKCIIKKSLSNLSLPSLTSEKCEDKNINSDDSFVKKSLSHLSLVSLMNMDKSFGATNPTKKSQFCWTTAKQRSSKAGHLCKNNRDLQNYLSKSTDEVQQYVKNDVSIAAYLKTHRHELPKTKSIRAKTLSASVA